MPSKPSPIMQGHQLINKTESTDSSSAMMVEDNPSKGGGSSIFQTPARQQPKYRRQNSDQDHNDHDDDDDIFPMTPSPSRRSAGGIFVASPRPSLPHEGLLMIRRCNAFDEGN